MEFSSEAIGITVPCPHCAKLVTLSDEDSPPIRDAPLTTTRRSKPPKWNSFVLGSIISFILIYYVAWKYCVYTIPPPSNPMTEHEATVHMNTVLIVPLIITVIISFVIGASLIVFHKSGEIVKQWFDK